MTIAYIWCTFGNISCADYLIESIDSVFEGCKLRKTKMAGHLPDRAVLFRSLMDDSHLKIINMNYKIRIPHLLPLLVVCRCLGRMWYAPWRCWSFSMLAILACKNNGLMRKLPEPFYHWLFNLSVQWFTEAEFRCRIFFPIVKCFDFLKYPGGSQQMKLALRF